MAEDDLAARGADVERDESELQDLGVALELFREGRISTGKAAELLGWSKIEFTQVLARRSVAHGAARIFGVQFSTPWLAGALCGPCVARWEGGRSPLHWSRSTQDCVPRAGGLQAHADGAWAACRTECGEEVLHGWDSQAGAV